MALKDTAMWAVLGHLRIGVFERSSAHFTTGVWQDEGVVRWGLLLSAVAD